VKYTKRDASRLRNLKLPFVTISEEIYGLSLAQIHNMAVRTTNHNGDPDEEAAGNEAVQKVIDAAQAAIMKIASTDDKIKPVHSVYALTYLLGRMVTMMDEVFGCVPPPPPSKEQTPTVQ
jgi:hypothetical protein